MILNFRYLYDWWFLLFCLFIDFYVEHIKFMVCYYVMFWLDLGICEVIVSK
jgi:hypothetical protein